jgi:hypothetical protein
MKKILTILFILFSIISFSQTKYRDTVIFQNGMVIVNQSGYPSYPIVGELWMKRDTLRQWTGTTWLTMGGSLSTTVPYLQHINSLTDTVNITSSYGSGGGNTIQNLVYAGGGIGGSSGSSGIQSSITTAGNTTYSGLVASPTSGIMIEAATPYLSYYNYIQVNPNTSGIQFYNTYATKSTTTTMTNTGMCINGSANDSTLKIVGSAHITTNLKVDGAITGTASGNIPSSKTSNPSISPFTNNAITKSIAMTGDSMVIKGNWTHDNYSGFSFLNTKIKFDPSNSSTYVWQLLMNSDYATYKTTQLGIPSTGGIQYKSDATFTISKNNGTNTITIDPVAGTMNIPTGGSYQINSVSLPTPAYGGLYFGSNTIATTLGTITCTNSTGSTWTWATVKNAGLIRGDSVLTTYNRTNGTITIATGGAGYYRVEYSISCKGSQSVGGSVVAIVQVGGSSQLNTQSQTLWTNASDYRTLSGNGIINLSDGNVVTLALATVSAGDEIVTIIECSLSINRIGN